MCAMNARKRIFLALELVIWTGVFAWLFFGNEAGANLVFGLPVVLALIGVRVALAVVVDAFVSVGRGLLGRE